MKLIPIIIAGALMVGSGLTGVIGGSVKIAQENGGDQGGTSSESSPTARPLSFHGEGSENVFLTAGNYLYFSYVPYQSFRATFYSTSSLDPRAWLLEGSIDGRTLAENDDGGDGHNFSMVYDVQAYRMYILKVYVYDTDGTSGWGTINVSGAGSSTSSAPAWTSQAPSGSNNYDIYAGNPVWVSCSYDNPATLTFNPNSNSTYAFYSTGNYDTYGELYQISMGYSQNVATNDDSDGRNFRIEYYCSVSFIYNLKVRPYSSEDGTISFYVYCEYV